MKIIIVGSAGVLGRLVAHDLVAQRHHVLGIDLRPWIEAPAGMHCLQSDIRKRPAEDLVRTHKPDAIIHLATVTHLRDRTSDKRRTNLEGTRAVFEYAHRYGVQRAVFVGRHTYYGATPDSPLYHEESDPPMAVQSYPELSDLVAADLYAGSELWRYPDVATSVLRLCYTLGPHKHGTLASYLVGPRVPTVLGFDPLFQFMHEFDAARAITLAATRGIRGVFNVAGPPPLPFSTIIHETGRSNLPLPERTLPWVLGRFGLPWLPPAAIAHLKYPLVIDDASFRQATDFAPHYDERQTLTAFRYA